MNQSEFEDFKTALSTVADYYGKKLSAAAFTVWWNGLRNVELSAIKVALNEHVQIAKFMPTISDVLDVLRVMDGRPSPEEAWSMVARSLNDEGPTIVWTEEIASAFGVALGLQEDRIAARMAFKETYAAAVAEARKQGKAAVWSASPGRDPGGREVVLRDAVERGRLRSDYVDGMLPPPSDPAMMLKNPAMAKLLTDKRTAMPGGIRDALRKAAGMT